ncbi:MULTISPECIES: Maf family protein [Amniculibacterium]|jgi:septum formation protein|uniref:Maf family protein n=1 Tax=Amniculibacterium TaxID=2715289 RepID=UPI000F59F789|nr:MULTISPECIES: Maf family nucleotide pyrophosphatase [Amniculibacterium]
MKLLLASNSPRRKELLQELGFEYQVVNIDCDESFPENLPSEEVAAFVSLLKSNAYSNLDNDEILITADTVVALEGTILGKPKDKEDAKKMLQQLSGKTHQVYTAFTLKNNDKSITKTDVAQVSFLEISDQEIEFYLEKYQPYDKAGSYGVQEWLGMAKISKIEGSYYTIMGLPTHEIYPLIFDFQKIQH